MSYGLGTDGWAALEVIDACDGLFARLSDLVDRHEYIADVARPEWAGPHRTTFEDRFDTVQYRLRSGEGWLLHVRRIATEVLQSAMAQMQEENAAVSRVGGRR